MYEWKVIEWCFSQGYGAVQFERDRMLKQGFEFVITFLKNDCHYNVYRKTLAKKWTESEIAPNLIVKNVDGTTFLVIRLNSEDGHMLGWVLFSPDDCIAYQPPYSTQELVVYLNENGFT